MIKKSAGKQPIVSNPDVPRLNMLLKNEGTREKTRSKHTEKSVQTQREEAQKALRFALEVEEKTVGTERRTKPESEKPGKGKSTKLLRQKSEQSIDRLASEKKANNKKEKPSKPLEREKSSTSLFSRKKPNSTIQSAARAVQAQTATVNLPTPPSNSANCCRDILRIFTEAQYEPLRGPLKAHCYKAGVDEQHDFLEAVAGYSNDHLPTPRQAQALIDTYGPKGDKPLNIEAESDWAANPWDTAQAAVDRGDMPEFFATLLGPDNRSVNDFASAILPQLALGLAQKYAPFVQAHTPKADT